MNRQLRRFPGRLFDRSDRQRRTGQDIRHPSVNFGTQFIGRHHCIAETIAGGFRTGHHPPCHHQSGHGFSGASGCNMIMPPSGARPFTLAITGMFRLRQIAILPKAFSISDAQYSTPDFPASDLRSAPALNACSPAQVKAPVCVSRKELNLKPGELNDTRWVVLHISGAKFRRRYDVQDKRQV